MCLDIGLISPKLVVRLKKKIYMSFNGNRLTYFLLKSQAMKYAKNTKKIIGNMKQTTNDGRKCLAV